MAEVCIAHVEKAMTRRDYEQLAEALKGVKPPESDGHEAARVWENCVRVVADCLAQDNARFSWTKFKDHCGLTDE